MKNITMKYCAAAALSACLLVPAIAQADNDEETEALKQQIELMRHQLEQMQQRLSTMEAERDAERTETEEVEERLAAVEEKSTAEKVADGIKFGGLVRTNYAWRDYDDQNKDRLGDYEMEVFGVGVDGEVGNVMLSAQWRRYNDFQAVKYAWAGYRFSDSLHMELGVTQVPFGILPWTANNFWFSGNYYIGYEDDYDAGIKFVQESDDWTFHYAFFKNPEYANDGRFGRYSADLATSDLQQNTETNQVNFRAERHLTFSDTSRMDVGLSLQAGQIYNQITEDNGDRWAAAVHMDGYWGPWNLRLQALRYEYSPENPEGVSEDFVQKAFFGFPHLMAAKANSYTVNLAHSFDVDWGPISNVNCYNDFTYIDPDVDNSDESVQNVTGCSVTAGGLFTTFDWIVGKNMVFINGDGVGLNGGSAGRWDRRLNINFGYYF